MLKWLKNIFSKTKTEYVYNSKPYDTSTKEYEILRIEYKWSKYTRKLSNIPEWKHYRYYKTEQGIVDALYALRRSFYDKFYYDYPGEKLEKKYHYITPTISIYRYKARKREL